MRRGDYGLTPFLHIQTMARLNEQAANFEGDIARLETQIRAENDALTELEVKMGTALNEEGEVKIYQTVCGLRHYRNFLVQSVVSGS